ncbi:MAG: hypothetical protein M3O70_22430 [Actinomycetota bacterium]|nr:hypothetical protein [Actinomycetota bacterium]
MTWLEIVILPLLGVFAVVSALVTYWLGYRDGQASSASGCCRGGGEDWRIPDYPPTDGVEVDPAHRH